MARRTRGTPSEAVKLGAFWIAVLVFSPLLALRELFAMLYVGWVRARAGAKDEEPVYVAIAEGELRFRQQAWRLSTLARVDAWCVGVGTMAATGEDTYVLRLIPRNGKAVGLVTMTSWGAELDALEREGLLRRRWSMHPMFLLWPFILVGVIGWSLGLALLFRSPVL